MFAFAPKQLSESWRRTFFDSVEEHLGVSYAQLYCPHHERFFNMTDDMRLNTTVAPVRQLVRMTSDNSGMVSGTDLAETNTPLHFKLCPLVDPLDYLHGTPTAVDQAIVLPTPVSPESQPIPMSIDPNDPSLPTPTFRANSIHNRAYTDAFFVYLSSRILHNYQIVNAINYYGVFTGIKHDYKQNIVDDLDELWESESFLRGIDDRFVLDATPLKEAFLALRDNSLPPDEKPLISFEPHTGSPAVHAVDLGIEDITQSLTPLASTTDIAPAPEPYDFPDYDAITSLQDDPTHLDPESDSEGESNRTSITTVTEAGGSPTLHLQQRPSTKGMQEKGGSDSGGSEDSMESESGSSDEEDSESNDAAWCTIPEIAVSVIVQERLEGTLQDLLDSAELTEAEWRSCLFQIAAMLHAYNIAYDFVHNDLHAANVMFHTTNEANLVYRHRGVTYRVPTYGRIFKIIDFGRATFRFGTLTFLNDCYEDGNDAANQYNYDRLTDPDTPSCIPHYSFDLCRLACGLYDYFDAEEEYPEDCEPTGAAAMIDRWCRDDDGKNMLYKKSGAERYPGFKLYRMIARKVTRHVPGDVLEDPWFVTFRVHSKRAKKLKTRPMNLDAVKPEYRLPRTEDPAQIQLPPA